MRKRKSIIEIIIWIIFTVVFIFAAVQNVNSLFSVVPQNEWITEGLILGAVFCIIVGVITGMRFIIFSIGKKFSISQKKKWILEGIAFLVLLGVMIEVQVIMLNHASFLGLKNDIMNAALVKSAGTSEQFASRITQMYITMLSALFWLLGNKVVFAVYFNVFLQCLSIIFLYFMLRNINGVVNAFFTTLIIAVIQPIWYLAIPVTEEPFFLCIMTFGMWVVSITIRKISNPKCNRVWRVIHIILLGAVLAFISYLDIRGTALVLMSFSGIFSYKEKGFLTALSTVVSSITFYGLYYFTEAFCHGQDFISFLIHRINEMESQIEITVPNILPYAVYEISFAFIILALSWAVGFWLSKKDENLLYVIFFLVITGMKFVFPNMMPYNNLTSIAWILIITTSVISIWTKGEATTQIDVPNDATSKVRNGVSNVATNDIANDVAAKEVTSKDVTVRKAAPAFIPNPLPLPKKHVHKEMNYAIEVKEYDMDYDIKELDENDDFDIK